MPRKQRPPLMATRCPRCGYELCILLPDLVSNGAPLCPCNPGGVRMEIGGAGRCDNQSPDGRCLGHGRPGGPN